MADTSTAPLASDPVDPRARTPGWARILIAVLLLAPMGLAVDSLRGKSWTWDEPIYLAGGHYLFRTGNLRNQALQYHPPLVLYWNSLGLAPLPLDRDLFPPSTTDHDREVGMQVAFSSGHDPARVRLLARLPFVLLIPVLGALVYWWARDLWGWRGGLLSLWLVAWNPTLLAHARLVGTDYLFTVLFVATLWAGRALLQRGGARRVVQAGVLTGLTFLAKFTAVILLPCAVVGAWFAARPAGGEGGAARWRTWSARRVALGLAAGSGLALVVLWLGYLAEVAPAIPAEHQRLAFAQHPPPPGLLGGLMYALYVRDIPLPAMTYLMGFFSQFVHGAGGHSNYLLGETRLGGWWYYFPLAVLVKTPLPELGLWLAGAVAWWRSGAGRREAVWLAVGPAVLFLLSARANINIGVRHVLILYPLAAVCAGACIRWWPQRAGRVALGVALAWVLGTTLHAHPHYLTSFNPLAGGAAGGHRVLVDSNLDWGQDAEALFARAQAEGWLPLRVQYFGPPGRLEHAPAGVTAWEDPCAPTEGYLAVSVTNRVGAYMDEGAACFAWLDAHEPIARINHSIWVYHVPPEEAARGAP